MAIGQNKPIPQSKQLAAVHRWAIEIDRVLARARTCKDFEQLFSAFKQTAIAAQAAQRYGDIFYLYEARYRGKAVFMCRF